MNFNKNFCVLINFNRTLCLYSDVFLYPWVKDVIPRPSCVYDLPGSHTLRWEEGARLGWAEFGWAVPRVPVLLGTELPPRGHGDKLHIPANRGAGGSWEPIRGTVNRWSSKVNKKSWWGIGLVWTPALCLALHGSVGLKAFCSLSEEAALFKL